MLTDNAYRYPAPNESSRPPVLFLTFVWISFPPTLGLPGDLIPSRFPYLLQMYFPSQPHVPHTPPLVLHVFLDLISQEYVFRWHRYLLLSIINVQVTFCWFSPYGLIFSCPLLRVDQNILINERKRQLCGLNTASQMKHAYCASIFPRPAVTSFSWPWQHNCLINPHTMGRNFIFCTLFRISEPLKPTKRWV